MCCKFLSAKVPAKHPTFVPEWLQLYDRYARQIQFTEFHHIRNTTGSPGRGTMTSPLHPMSRISARISSRKFHASSKTVVGPLPNACLGGTMGISVPGVNRPCLKIFLSAISTKQ